jgi:predicted  nucleic acid-binding Zn-ribbon protein
MKFTRWTVAFYMGLVFACGAVVGSFAYRLYTVSAVSANVGRRDPEEYRKRFMAELKNRLNLNDDQAAKVEAIMDQTRQQFRAARATIEPEIQKIREEQRQKISGILAADQQAEFQKMMEQRRRMRESKKDSGVAAPQQQ